MSEIFERLTKLAEHAMGRIRVSSALNPALYLCAFTTPMGMIGSIISSGPVQTACLTVMLGPIGLFGISYLFFMLTNADKLRSEEYELRKMALELIEEKGSTITLNSSSVEAISNYEYKVLPRSNSEGDEDASK